MVFDAQIELGRYERAGATIQRLVDLKPGLASYSSASYFRELGGDVSGAVEAMRLAASAAGGAAESSAYVRALLGDLELGRGRVDAARDAYRDALRSLPDYPAGLAGLARVDAASGDLGSAAARLRRATDRLPLTTTLTLLADVELALGRRVAARGDLAAARTQHEMLAASGTMPDAEAVLFEASHGSPASAVELGRRVWRAAPSVRSADALGWALTRAGRPAAALPWARRALALGSRDPAFNLHAGVAAARVGLGEEAERRLRDRAAGSGGTDAELGEEAPVSAAIVTRSRSPAILAGNRGLATRVAILALALALLAPAGAAQAHPLGNFSVNHLSTVSVSADRVDVRYVLDQAEIPTVQERGLGRAEILARKLEEIRKGLTLTVDGRAEELRQTGPPRLTFPDGAGGLNTTRLTVSLTAAVDAPERATLEDNTFAGRVGWKAIVSAPGDGTAVRTRAPSGDPTRGLTRYPDDLLDSPANRTQASFQVEPGDGTLTAPKGEGGAGFETGGSEEGFAGLFEDAASGEGVLLLLLLAAFGWGALHALSPGHGKAMVAAYLIGTRGTAKHAVALGATVTVTHTIGVFALGVVTLALSQYVLPEDLYPWLTLVAGLMVVVIGAGVLRSRVRSAKAQPASSPPPRHDLSWKGVVGMGTAAGLIPCPSALVVLLAAISQHEVALGLLLILAFSLGLAGTLTVLGLAVVYAKKLIPPRLAAGRLAAALPAASALLIVAIGAVLTARAVPAVV